MAIITQEVSAWLTEHKASSPDLDMGSVESFTYLNIDMSGTGWTKVGTATITLHIDDKDQICNNMVGALKAQKQKIQADAQRELNRIDERIQSLLALPAPSESTP